MRLIVALIVGRALIVLRFKQCDGYDGDGGGGDAAADLGRVVLVEIGGQLVDLHAMPCALRPDLMPRHRGD